MALAEKFHRADVDRFLSEIPAPMYQEWHAYYNVQQQELEMEKAKRRV